MDIKIKGSRKHEEDFAELIGGTRVPGSGSQWHNKGDAANQHFKLFAFRGDCKCTQGQSISVSRAMIKKLLDDAGGERPALPLRFYKNERLDIEYDFVAVLADDFGELLENARRAAELEGEIAPLAAQLADYKDEVRPQLAEYEALKARVAEAMIVNIPEHLTDEDVAEFHRQLTEAMESGLQVRWADPKDSAPVPDETFAAMSAALIAAQDRQAELEGQLTEQRERADDLERQASGAVLVPHEPGELERLRLDLAEADRSLLESHQENGRLALALGAAEAKIAAAPQPEAPSQAPVDIPQLPWMVVHQVKIPGGRVAMTGTWWDEKGHSHPTAVRSIRLQPDGPTTEQLFVNDRRVREGDLYIDGARRVRVGAR